MVTSLKEREERVKGLEVGADDFLTKPVDSCELLARVKSLLRIKQLQDELLEMNQSLEQKVKEQVGQIQKLSSMKRYISPQIAERLISEGTTVGQIAEEMEPEELLEMLNKYFSEMTKIVFKYGGTIDKFMGDGIMGFIGDPCEYPDHAQRAIKMATEMQSKVKDLSSDWFSYGTSSLQIGIGINTGYVTVGDIGSEAHMDYTVVGRHVNLAARLQQEAKPGQIVVSQRTYSLVKDMVEAEEIGKVEMKGFDKPVVVYDVYGVSGLK
jgi:class 3 adenylate cyclase